MKINVFAGLLVVATLGFFATNANAQDVAAPAPVVAQECNECVGLPVPGSRLAAKLSARSPRQRLYNTLYVRDIVEASPFATPSGEPGDWERFRYYPYGYYPHNFKAGAPSMQVQKYNPAWQNYYPVPRRFHEGKHFILDVF